MIPGAIIIEPYPGKGYTIDTPLIKSAGYDAPMLILLDVSTANGGLFKTKLNYEFIHMNAVRSIRVNEELRDTGLDVKFRFYEDIFGTYAMSPKSDADGWFSLDSGEVDFKDIGFTSIMPLSDPNSMEIFFTFVSSIEISYNFDVARKACCCGEAISAVMLCNSDIMCSDVVCDVIAAPSVGQVQTPDESGPTAVDNVTPVDNVTQIKPDDKINIWFILLIILVIISAIVGMIVGIRQWRHTRVFKIDK